MDSAITGSDTRVQPPSRYDRPPLQPWRQSRRAVWAVLFVILSLALALRLYGINWDQGGLFHPDERAILFKVNDLDVPSFGEVPDLFDAEESPWNPAWFSYGSLPLYLLKIVDVIASPVTEWNFFDLRYPGRVLSALADTALVGLLFLFGRAWLGKRVGLLAALFGALAVIEIQLSHFYTVDTFLAFFTAAAIFFMVRVAYSGRKGDSIAAGALVGLALATKASAAVLLAPLAFSHLIYAFAEPGDVLRLTTDRLEVRQRGLLALRRIAYSTIAGLAVLLVAQPYMFLDWGTYRESVSHEGEMVRRVIDLPYTRQYIDTPRYIYQFWQLGTYGLGPVLGLLGWLSVVAGGLYALRTRRKFDLVVWAWMLPYLLITGWFEVKFLRYLLPVVPFMLLYAARMLVYVLDRVREWRPDYRYAGPALIAIVVAFTAHYAISYETIYGRNHPAQATAEWIRQNTPRDALVLKEHWEEGIPGTEPRFREELELYNPDTEFKFTRISSQLSRADYLVFYSNRLFATIPRLEERYPASSQYYERLFNGSLGYELVHVDQSVPSALGVAYDEDTFGRTELGEPAGYEAKGGRLATIRFGWADESFFVYDHPKVLVFQNTERLGQQELFARITGTPPERPAPVGLLLSVDDLQAQRAGGTYSDITTFGTGSAGYSWVVWLLAAQVIGLLAVPIGHFAFSPLAGRGYLLSKVLGLLIVSFLAWLMASVGIMDFSRGSILVSMAALAVVSGLVLYRNRASMIAYWRENRRLILIMESIFLAAFFVFLVVRAANPDLWHPFRGGEKPMDLAYLNAVTRSTVMPPYDPWFAGGYLNYYYFGQFVVATMIRLTGIETAIAYNLAVPLLFALTAGAVFSIVYALVDGARVAMGGAGRLARGPVLAGLGGVVFILVAGNLDGLVQVFEGIGRVWFKGEPFGAFDFWRSSRMFAPGSPGNEITEFPFFTFLFADLHAHLISIPFTLLTLGLAIAVFFRILSAGGGRVEQWGSVVLLGLAAGSLRVINAWDWPTYMAIGGGAIAIATLMAKDSTLRLRLLRGAAMGGVMVAVSYFAYLPFHLNFELFNDGIEDSATRTPLWRYWYIHAPFIALILSYITWQAWTTVPAALARLNIEGWLAGLLAALALVAAVVFGAAGYATVAFAVAVIVAIFVLAAIGIASPTPRLRYELVIAAMVVIALGIGAGVDLITVKGDIGRMNTVFKFYLQAWILMGIASTYIAWRFASAGAFSMKRIDASRWARRAFAPALATNGRRAWAGGLAVMAVGIMIYPVMGTQVRLRDRFNTDDFGLDGQAYMEKAIQWEQSTPIELRHDLQAIQWLQENVKGSPVIVEGLTDLYHLGNRVSINTGLPAVIGWDWHQRQQRVGYAGEVSRRRFDVDRIYTTIDPDEAMRLLRKYDVSYVYVGDLERVQYDDAGLEKFRSMGRYGLAPAYENERVTIYELRDAATALAPQ